jgi:predicted alpha/beta-fold hydrolase
MRYTFSIFYACLTLLAAAGSVRAQVQVSFFTSDSVTIYGDWYASPDSSNRVLILLHMNGSDRSQWKNFASTASAQHFHVLAVDFRGHGQSIESTSGLIRFNTLTDGDYADMVLDVDAAVKWVRSHTDLELAPIGIIGASIGANVALSYAANYQQIAAIALLSPGLDYRGVKTEAALRKFGNRPILIIAAQDDNYASVSSNTLASIGGTATEYFQYESGGHGTFLFESQADLSERLLRFMNNYLK